MNTSSSNGNEFPVFSPSLVFLLDWIGEKRINEFCYYGDCVPSIKTAWLSVSSSCCNLSFGMKSTPWSVCLAMPFLNTSFLQFNTFFFLYPHHTSVKYLIYHGTKLTYSQKGKKKGNHTLCSPFLVQTSL